MATEKAVAGDASGQSDVRIFYTCFSVCAVLVALFFYMAPPADMAECSGVSMGWMIKNARDPDAQKKLYECASVYRKDNEATLLIGFILTYVLFQTFAIPGPIVLSVLSGALYPYFYAHLLVAASATSGATFCFLISKILGNGLLTAWNLQEKVVWFRQQVAENKEKGRLMTYMVLTRVTPVPNVLINVASPLVGVPTHVFFLSTLAGLVPLNAVHISTGFAIVSATQVDKRIPMVIFACGTVIVLAMLWRDRKEKAAAAKDTKKE